MKAVAEEVVRKSSADMNSKLMQRTKQIREYVDGQLRGQQEDYKTRYDQSGSLPDLINSSLRTGIHTMMTNHGGTMDDLKTKTLKNALQTEVSNAMLAQKLQCRPIEGHDIPLAQLQQDIQGSSALLEVEVIEKIENEISDSEQLLSMLLPN